VGRRNFVQFVHPISYRVGLAEIAGLDSLTWRDPDRYGSLLDAGGGVLREEPLVGADEK